MRFVGRTHEFEVLDERLRRVAESGTGTMLAVRGRRQVGKSRLFTRFLERTSVAHVFFTATKGATTASQLENFQADVFAATNRIIDAETLFASAPSTWADALGRLRLAARTGPLVVILDEFPWATEADGSLEGVVQREWDRHLQHLPVLCILVGSDVAMMERLTTHDRPLYGRASEMEIHPFNPAEIAAALGRNATPIDVFDAYLGTGGYPKLVSEFVASGDLAAYVAGGFRDENSDLIVVAQRSLDAEFPPEAQARRVLGAIGGEPVGHATFSSVVGRLPEAGTAAETALSRALKILADTTHVVAIDTPVGAGGGTRLRRYRIQDPYLRFWFRFVAPHVTAVARGRGDLAERAFRDGWTSWRGTAIEPVVHDAISRLAPDVDLLEGVEQVGAWWTRDHRTQIDVVASSRRTVRAIGSIKWRNRRQFSVEELDELGSGRSAVPNAERAALVAVCPAGVRSRATPDLAFDAADLLAAWTS